MRVSLLAALALLAGCAGPTNGAETPRAAVDAYVAALNAKDVAALERLAPPRVSATEDIQRRLEAHGGKGIELDVADIVEGISPKKVMTARLRGRTAAGPSYEDQLTLTSTNDDDRWNVVLGRG